MKLNLTQYDEDVSMSQMIRVFQSETINIGHLKCTNVLFSSMSRQKQASLQPQTADRLGYIPYHVHAILLHFVN